MCLPGHLVFMCLSVPYIYVRVCGCLGVPLGISEAHLGIPVNL